MPDPMDDKDLGSAEGSVNISHGHLKEKGLADHGAGVRSILLPEDWKTMPRVKLAATVDRWIIDSIRE